METQQDSLYKQLVEQLIAGQTKHISGVTLHTAKRSLQRAKKALYEDAAAHGFELPRMELVIKQLEGSIIECSAREPVHRGFHRKLQILD